MLYSLSRDTLYSFLLGFGVPKGAGPYRLILDFDRITAEEAAPLVSISTFLREPRNHCHFLF